MTNIMLHNGELSYAEVLGERFAEQVPTTINFAFNSAVLDEQARAILREQAAFIRHFPEVRFTVYGHTDLVGSRCLQPPSRPAPGPRGDALHHQPGRGPPRLQALVSRGERPGRGHPDGRTPQPPHRDHGDGLRAVHPLVLDGEYARIVYRAYAGAGAE
jgi:peptidoglycan-associated lipoprotein